MVFSIAKYFREKFWFKTAWQREGERKIKAWLLASQYLFLKKEPNKNDWNGRIVSSWRNLSYIMLLWDGHWLQIPDGQFFWVVSSGEKWRVQLEAFALLMSAEFSSFSTWMNNSSKLYPFHSLHYHSMHFYLMKMYLVLSLNIRYIRHIWTLAQICVWCQR